jgi:hypothetical protein
VSGNVEVLIKLLNSLVLFSLSFLDNLGFNKFRVKRTYGSKVGNLKRKG